MRYDSQDLLELVNLFFHNAALDGRLEQNLNYWVNTTGLEERPLMQPLAAS